MTDLPEPLTPADCDLRGYEYMPLFGHKLFGSELYMSCSGEEFRTAVRLWWSAWNQVPAGSLPNDDAPLALLADCGRDVKGWLKIKAKVLRGFILCSDGRLYHPMLCDAALNGFDLRLKADKKRVKDRERLKAWREEQARKRAAEKAAKRGGDDGGSSDPAGDETSGETRFTGGFETGDEQATKRQTSPREGEGEGERKKEPVASLPRVIAPVEPDASLDAVAAWNTMAAGNGLSQVQRLTDTRRKHLQARLRECGGLDGWHDALRLVGESAFLLGDSRSGWKADFDWILQASSFAKLMEGAYGNRGEQRAPDPVQGGGRFAVYGHLSATRGYDA